MHLTSCGLTIGYVGILYVRRGTRPAPGKSRDDPTVIRQRLLSIAFYTAVVCYLYHGRIDFSLDAQKAYTVLKVLGVTASLFIGPLIDHILTALAYGPVELDFSSGVYAVRDYCVGPVTEEIVFRAALLSEIHPTTALRAITISPLYFGVAHVHHAYESHLLYNTPWIALALNTLFQFAFTSLFGGYAAYLFYRTGTVYAPIACHVFCNLVGPPTGAVYLPSWVYNGLLLVGVVLFSYFVRLK
ncbi:hypothetical protein TRVA0_038S00606 [Trichomonascus vanleenenianus]|uniref:CAAX prenyl protease n=1 Tax=Trichomonascus vanleenenianus TaxID=2268995 RepID=UPI003ECB4DD4